MKLRPLILCAALIMLVPVLSSCALFGAAVDDLNSYLSGRSATITTYNQAGAQIDVIKGKSIDIRRDETFDSTNSDGSSNSDSSVLKISVGDGIIRHVGSTLVLAEDGLVKVSDAATTLDLENTEPGRPWLNYLYEQNRNVWEGKAKTIMIRSQDGTPVSVYAGNKVEVFNPDIPKTTWFRIDGKTLLVYRADYSVIDTALLTD